MKEKKKTNIVKQQSKKLSSLESTTHIYALGGLDEIGKNMYCLETKKELLVIDAGQKFTERTTFSADAKIPNYKFLQKRKDKLVGIFITHGHEDHIGAIPYLLQHIKINKLYVTNVSKQLITNKLDYSGIPYSPNIFKFLTVNVPIKTKDFIVTPFFVNHSIPEALGFHIQTPSGKIIFTGDFKFDQAAPGERASYNLISKWGKEGVDLLMSDSTNSLVEGYSKSENDIGIQIEKLISMSKNRIIISTFSSNMYRVRQIINSAIKNKRKVCVIGRSMEAAVDILIKLNYLQIGDWKISENHLPNYEKNKVLIICTGSQGETLAALKRIADNRIKNVEIDPGDEVVFSSSPIPGNRHYINHLTNSLVKKGATVIDSSQFESIHASGHGYKLEQQLMINLVRPKYFFPIHGNASMLKQHRINAKECGIPLINSFLCSNGDVLELKNKRVSRHPRIVPSDVYYVESKTNKILDNDINIESSEMGKNGVVLVHILINSKNHQIADLKIDYIGCSNQKRNSEEALFSKNLLTKLKKDDSINLNSKDYQVIIENIIKKEIRDFRKITPYILINSLHL